MTANLDGQVLPNRSLAVSPGKLVRAPFLFQPSKPIIFAPIDDFLLLGPKGGLEHRSDAVRSVFGSDVDAVLTFPGTVSHYGADLGQSKYFLNLSASTTRVEHTNKKPLAGIETALRLNAAGVAYHINLLAPSANQMIADGSALLESAARYDLPCLGIVYPRSTNEQGGDDNQERLRSENPDEFADLVAHCVAVGADLGFDCVKTVYTGSRESFARVVDAAGPMPVVVAGGPLVPFTDATRLALNAVEAGARGISFGRNLFGRTDPANFVRGLRRSWNPADTRAVITRPEVNTWVSQLVHAWESRQPEHALGLFTDCVEYLETPFSPNAAEAPNGIALLWEEILSQSNISISTEVLSVESNVATVRYDATFETNGSSHSSSGTWAIRFASGRCSSFRQWFMVEE